MWQPDPKQKEVLKTVLRMTLDCLEGKGTTTVEAYTFNLEVYISMLRDNQK